MRVMLQHIQQKYPQLRILSLRIRSSKISALDDDFCSVKEQLTAKMDTDLQKDPADIPCSCNGSKKTIVTWPMDGDSNIMTTDCVCCRCGSATECAIG